jgi:hypothetical protein
VAETSTAATATAARAVCCPTAVAVERAADGSPGPARASAPLRVACLASTLTSPSCALPWTTPPRSALPCPTLPGTSTASPPPLLPAPCRLRTRARISRKRSAALARPEAPVSASALRLLATRSSCASKVDSNMRCSTSSRALLSCHLRALADVARALAELAPRPPPLASASADFAIRSS